MGDELRSLLDSARQLEHGDDLGAAEAAGLALAGAAAGADRPDLVYTGRVLAGRAVLLRGEGGRAAKLFRRALDVVEATPDLAHFRAPALHHVFTGYAEARAAPAAEAFYRRARHAYGDDAVRRTRLDGDCGYVHVLRKHWRAAVQVLEPMVAAGIDDGPVAARAQANLAVACAHLGRNSDAESLVRHVVRRVENGDAGDARVFVLTSAAHAYLVLGQQDAVVYHATEAKRLARIRGEASEQVVIGRILQRVRN